MSTEIEQRVVEMQFDNKQFERNVSTTMSSLDKLKQSLNLTGAAKGLESVGTAARGINLSGLTSAAETVSLKFNAMYSGIDQIFRNLVTRAQYAGERILSALTIDPIKTGLQEYETQINAVQTILANTESKGTTLKDVNGALDELNTYADKTIYNFTEMTRNIGTFTAAGVDLDTSVNAIQGIANLAAVSGSSSQQASTAMYQLSQALASGTVKLMDWNSVVNAGMGGQVFQDALKETARVHGIAIDDMIKRNGSFRETLQEGWLTADILTETLSHFTMAAEEGSDQWNEYKKSLMDSGYSEEQANAILKLSNTATDAATKVKTATQLFDTLKETAQSGWTQTWEIIFGDFEEAKSLFSELYETLAPILEASAKARNELLEGWAKAGGRADLLESLRNILEGIGNIIKPIKEAFREFFPATTVDQLVSFTSKIKELTEQFANAFNPNLTKANRIIGDGKSNFDKLKRTFRGLFAVLDIVKQAFGAVLKAITPLFGKVGDLGGGILDVTAKIGDWLVGLNESIKKSGFFTKAVESIHTAFKHIGSFLKNVVDGVKEFGAVLSDSFIDVASRASERLSPLTVLGNIIKNIFVGVGKAIGKIFPFISAAATGIGNVLGELMDRISDSFQNMNFDSLFDVANGGIITAIGVYIAKMFKSGSGILDNAGGFLDNIKDILGGVTDALGAFTDSIKADTLKKIATAIAILAASLLVLSLIPSEKLTTALVSITMLFGELMASMSIMSKLGDMQGVVKTASAIVTLASAVLVLGVALKIMSTMSWSEMGVGLTTMTVGLAELVGAVYLLSMMPDSELNGSVKAIKNLTSALLVLSVALKIMSTMSWKEMGVALISMTAGLAALVGAIWLLPQDTALRAAGLVGLAAAMVVLGAALKIMATMTWGELAISLVALAGSLAILAGAMNLMLTAIPGALAMLVVAPALIALAAALKIMATMSWEEIGKGLVALGGSLAILAIGMTAMLVAMPGAAALLVSAAALAVLTPVLMALGSMSLAEIGKSLLMIAGVFTVLGLSALILQPLVPAILALSGALALFGAACVTVGAGAVALGLGLTMIAASGSAAAVSLVTMVSSLISLIPYCIEQVGVGIVRLCETISGSAAAICSAVSVIVVALVDALVAAVPSLVEGAMVLIVSVLESLVNHLPQIATYLVVLVVRLIEALAAQMSTIIGAVFTLIASIFDGIANNLTILIEPFVNLFRTIFEAVAAVLGPIVEAVIAPLLSVLVDLIVGLVEAIAPYIPSIRAMIEAICAAFTFLASQIVPIIESITAFVKQLGITISQILNSIANVIVSIAAVIASALQGLANVFTSIFNGIATVITSVGDAIKSVLEGIASVIESVATAIESYLTGLSEVFDSVFNGIATVITSVGDSIKSVLEGIADVIESVGDAALNAGTGFENLANGVKTITNLSLADMAASLAAVATGIGDIASHSGDISTTADSVTKLSSGAGVVASKFGEITIALSAMIKAFTNADTVMKTVGANLISKVVDGIDKQKSKLGTAAKTAIKQFVDAIKNYQTAAKKACTNLVSGCIDVILNKAGAFKSAAKDLVRGFANGISANTYLATAKAKAMASAAASAARKELDEHSPSRVGYEIGDFFGIAFVNAIGDNTKRAYAASADMANSAKTGLKNAFDKVSRIISGEVDVNPTIRPVLDLTNVRSGANAINGMLGLRPSVGVLANIGAVSSMMDQRGQTASNDDVVSAINKLQKTLGNVSSTSYQINGITYDDGSNIAEAIRTITRAAVREGRV